MKGKPLWVLGCMSGTSLDGVDAALIRTDGRQILETGAAAFRAYSPEEREVLTTALGQWGGPAVEAATRVVEDAHAALIAEAGADCDLVAFHGQTLAHDPRGQGTLQVGDGAALAARIGTPVVWDFRSADVALGGQGAPLAPFFHHALARHAGLTAPAGFLNLGGVGNLTLCDPRLADPAVPGACMAFDTGPANAPINDLMQARRGEAQDRDGALAAAGTVDAEVVGRFLALPYFFKLPPKSLDRNDFPDLSLWVQSLSDADAAATLTACAAASVAAGLKVLETSPERLFLCGGGRHNPTLVEMITTYAERVVEPVDVLGCDGDMVEALAFGFLGARVINGLPTSAPGTTGVSAAVGGGQLSEPPVPAEP